MLWFADVDVADDDDEEQRQLRPRMRETAMTWRQRGLDDSGGGTIGYSGGMTIFSVTQHEGIGSVERDG